MRVSSVLCRIKPWYWFERSVFGHLDLGDLNLFRISDFGFRVLRRDTRGTEPADKRPARL